MSKEFSKKPQNNVLPTGMAYKYEVAYTQLFDMEKDWRRAIIIDEPTSRHGALLAHMAAILAEKGEITARECHLGDVKYDPYHLQQKVEVSGQK
jgi:hypothetical protein